jgi:hypothetical protein
MHPITIMDAMDLQLFRLRAVFMERQGLLLDRLRLDTILIEA